MRTHTCRRRRACLRSGCGAATIHQVCARAGEGGGIAGADGERRLSCRWRLV